MGKLKLIGVVLGVLVLASVICSISANATLDRSSHTLDSMALMKSMDVMNNQVSVIDKMVNVLTVQNVAIAVGAIVVFFMAFMLVRSGVSSGRGQPIVISGGQPYTHEQLPAGMPHFVSFGQRGQAFIRQLNRGQQEYMLAELENLCEELRHLLGHTNRPLISLPKSKSLARHDSDTDTIHWG